MNYVLSIIFDEMLQKETSRCKWDVFKKYKVAPVMSESSEAYASIAVAIV